MKKSPLIAIIAIISANLASGVTLNLIGTNALPPISFHPLGDHYDTYYFPSALLSTLPITSLRIEYSDDAILGEHLILETFFLFSSTPPFSTTETTNTQELYDATITFPVGITDISPSSPFEPAFAALHSGHSGANTEIIWTATYSDGSQAIQKDGIIPEPSSAILTGLAFCICLVRRSRNGGLTATN